MIMGINSDRSVRKDRLIGRGFRAWDWASTALPALVGRCDERGVLESAQVAAEAVEVAISLRMTAPPTDEELLELSRRNPGCQFERSSAGELIVTPTGSKGGHRELLLGEQLTRWAATDGHGLAFGASAGFRLPDGAVLSPDSCWVRRERWDALDPEAQEGFVPLCPDAVFEIVSRTDVGSAVQVKMRTYMNNGARLTVLIDPYRRTLEIHEPDQEVQVLENPRRLTFTRVLSDFSLNLESIFE